MKSKINTQAFAKPMTAVTALVLAMSMSPVAAIAAPSSDNDVADSAITITGLQNNDTVSAYQIADIDINADNTLKYTFANNVPADYDSVDELKAITSDGYSFTQGSKMQDVAAAIANGIVANGAITTATATGTEATLTLPSGYYLVRVTSTSGTSKVYQNMVVDVTPKAQADGTYASHDAKEIAVKSTDVTVTKTVGSANEASTDTYKVGDAVPFKITTAIPSYPANSPYATFVIADAPTAGLSIDTTSIKVEGATADTDYTFTPSASGYTIEFDRDFILANPGKSITVTYNAKVTKDAFSTNDSVTGNTATVKFNPNPYVDGTATPESKTTVQTYGYVFDKVGKDNAALEGAVFTLCDKNGNEIKDENGASITSTSTTVNGKAYVYFSGLAAGDYIAKETTVPSGYTAIDVPFSVSSADANANNPATTGVEENNFKVNTASVVDPQAPTLPVTGGAGTMAVTVAGVAFIGGAAYLIVRSRKKSEE